MGENPKNHLLQTKNAFDLKDEIANSSIQSDASEGKNVIGVK